MPRFEAPAQDCGEQLRRFMRLAVNAVGRLAVSLVVWPNPTFQRDRLRRPLNYSLEGLHATSGLA